MKGTLVALGGAAGGLEALKRFFASVAPDTGHAFVVIQLAQDRDEALKQEVLSAQTAMRVRHVQDGARLCANEVFLVPPQLDVGLVEDRFCVSPREPGRPRSPIDHFFRSAAASFGSSLTCVVLSGAGSDGSDGLLAVHEAGGRCLVQHPKTAEFDGMPKSAISTGVAEQIRSAESLANAISAVVGPLAECSPRQAGNFRLLNHIRNVTGHDFSQYKQGNLRRRLERRSARAGHTNPDNYLAQALTDPQEIEAITRDFLDGQTRFYRDTAVFDALGSGLLARALGVQAAADARIWSVGCSTGEEAYTIAILCEEHRLRSGGPRTRVLATDCDSRAIETAKKGRYSANSVSGLPGALREKYLKQEGDEFVIHDKIRETVDFSVHNALKDPPIAAINFAACRNLLTQLKQEAQSELLRRIHRSLCTSGLLLLGNSETASAAPGLFSAKEPRLGLYRSLQHAADSWIEPYLVGSDASSPTRRPIDEACGRILESTGGAAALVDANNEVVQIFGDISPYLRLGAGVLNFGNQSLSHAGTKGALSAALSKARQEGAEVEYQQLEFATPDICTTVNISVQPLASQQHALVVFRTAGVSDTNQTQELDHSGRAIASQAKPRSAWETARVTRERLDQELRAAKNELVTTDAALLAAKEALKTTSEAQQNARSKTPQLRQEAARLTRTQRMEAIGNLAGGVAHELNNVLSAIVGVIGAWEGKADTTSELQQDLSTMLSACARGKNLTSNLLSFSRRPSVVRDDVPLEAVVLEVYRQLKEKSKPGILITLKLPKNPIVVLGDRAQLAQALMNLCINALEAVGGSGAICIGLAKGATRSSQSTEELPESGARPKPPRQSTAVLSVTDDGCGMDADTLSQAFEPYFTTKARTSGTGLGLTTTFGVARTHGGWVDAKSTPELGSNFTIHLPTAESARDTHTASGTRSVVLLVDDDPLARQGMERLLISFGLHVLPFADGARAIEVVRDSKQRIDLAVVDLVMPRTDGLELLGQIREKRQKLPVVLYSGYADVSTDKRLRQNAITRFVGKPVDPARFQALLASLMKISRQKTRAV